MGSREHSRQEIVRKALKKGIDSSNINHVISVLEEQGLQSDDRFSEEFLLSKSRKGYGPIWINQELSKRGVGKESIDNAFRRVDMDWFETAEKIYSKKFTTEVTDVKDYARRIRFLNYKGFNPEHIKKIVGEWNS